MELVIRYLGFGESCNSCGKVRETTRYTLRQGEYLIQQFRLCDKCQDAGYVIKFEPKGPQAGRYRAQKKQLIKASQRLELGVAEDVGGRVTAGSGNQDTKGDIRRINEWRLEHKFTDGLRSYTLQAEDLGKIIRIANKAGELPALILTWRKLKRRFAIIPYELFLEIVEKLRGKIN
jgi:hypothetical protein